MAVDVAKIIFLILLLFGCSPKYEVIQELEKGQYHLQGVSDYEILIIDTRDPLNEGQIIKWKKKK